jgi:uncharacterized protein (DUF305 family)
MQQLGKRIELSQEDEIQMMQDWLRKRSLEVTSVDAHHAHGAMLMPGMLTPEEMNEPRRRVERSSMTFSCATGSSTTRVRSTW